MRLGNVLWREHIGVCSTVSLPASPLSHATMIHYSTTILHSTYNHDDASALPRPALLVSSFLSLQQLGFEFGHGLRVQHDLLCSSS